MYKVAMASNRALDRVNLDSKLIGTGGTYPRAAQACYPFCDMLIGDSFVVSYKTANDVMLFRLNARNSGMSNNHPRKYFVLKRSHTKTLECVRIA